MVFYIAEGIISGMIGGIGSTMHWAVRFYRGKSRHYLVPLNQLITQSIILEIFDCIDCLIKPILTLLHENLEFLFDIFSELL